MSRREWVETSDDPRCFGLRRIHGVDVAPALSFSVFFFPFGTFRAFPLPGENIWDGSWEREAVEEVLGELDLDAVDLEATE